jgi:hypothetical protein
MNSLKPVTEVRRGDRAFLSGKRYSEVVDVDEKDGMFTVVLADGTRLGPMTGSYFVEVAKEASTDA